MIKKYFKMFGYCLYACLIFAGMSVVCLVMIPTMFFIGLSGLGLIENEWVRVFR